MNLIELIPIFIIIITCITSLMAFNNNALFQRYAFNVGAITRDKQYYRFITSAFLHADMMHLFFNMFTLYFFSRVAIFGLVFGIGVGWQCVFILALPKTPKLHRNWGIRWGIWGVVCHGCACAFTNNLLVFYSCNILDFRNFIFCLFGSDDAQTTSRR